MKKRFLAILLTLVMALALTLPALAAPGKVEYNGYASMQLEVTLSEVISTGTVTITDLGNRRTEYPAYTVPVGTVMSSSNPTGNFMYGFAGYTFTSLGEDGEANYNYRGNGGPGPDNTYDAELTLDKACVGAWLIQVVNNNITSGEFVLVVTDGSAPAEPTTPAEPEKPTTPAEPEKPATAAELGLKVTGWAKADVDKALAAGLYDEALGKDMTVGITRAQAAAVAVKLYEAMNGEAMPAKDNPFTDTDDPNVVKAYSLGLVDGNGTGLFAPDAPLNREAVAVMLAKVYRKLGGTIPAAGAMKFADSAKISSWAKAEVSFMEGKGIVKGDGTNFKPQGPITGQEALILGLNMMSTLG